MENTTEYIGGPTHYKMAKIIEQVCGVLKLDIERVLSRAALPIDYRDQEKQGLTPSQAFAFWDAIFDEANDTTTALNLGVAFARAPMTPNTAAIICAPTVAEGVARMGTYSQIGAPFAHTHLDHPTGLMIRVASSDPSCDIPARLQLCFGVNIIEQIRLITGKHVVPLSVATAGASSEQDQYSTFFGCPVTAGDTLELVISNEDADLPILTRDDRRWQLIEPELKRLIEDATESKSTTSAARAALLELLPTGRANVELTAQKMNMSPRTLQRELGLENQSFTGLLNETRQDLAKEYLQHSAFGIDAIAKRLGYQNANSFYRAFSTWTGGTPQEFRNTLGDNPDECPTCSLGEALTDALDA